MTDRETMRMALEKIGKAHEKVAALCSGAERWTMSVPVRSDYDPDVVISDALTAAATAIIALRERLEQPQGDPCQCAECGKRSDEGWALYCVDCIAQIHDKPVFHLRSYGDVSEEDLKSLAQPQQEPVAHVTDGSKCWCEPELDYKDPDTGAEVWIHRGKQ